MKRLLLLSLATVAFVAAAAPEPASAQALTVKDSTAIAMPLAVVRNDTVMTIRALPEYATVPGVLSIDSAAVSRNRPTPAPDFERILGGLGAFALLGFAGTVKTASWDKDANPPLLAAFGAISEIVKDFYYFTQNRIIAATAATYPAVATGTTTSKVKVAQATVCLNNGVVNAVGITDDAWTLTGANLATGYSRKYLLLVDAADAFTVQASDDKASAADCRFSSRPADGKCILGILTVANASGADFVPGTTLLGAAGITATYIDGFSDLPYLSKVYTS